jgi:hypothetical protein
MIVFGLAAGLALLCSSLSGQILVLDKGLQTGIAGNRQQSLQSVSAKDGFFIGDDLAVGALTETWFIDTIRTWAYFESGSGYPFDKITLYGGISGQPVVKEKPDCACHSVVPIKTVTPQDSTELSLSAVDSEKESQIVANGKAFRLWKIEFHNVRWSVPGGVSIQFGLKPETKGAWCPYVSKIEDNRRLRKFDADGQLRSFLESDGRGINLQVWGHLSAGIEVRRDGQFINVRLRGGTVFDVKTVDTAGLRFGPNSSLPVTSRKERGKDSDDDLIAVFRMVDLGTSQRTVSVCLTGKRMDGVPFEGCDLLPREPDTQ